MYKFETNDKNLTIWVKGVTKRPEHLTQDDLQQLKDNGDLRVSETSDKPVTKEKPAAAVDPKP